MLESFCRLLLLLAGFAICGCIWDRTPQKTRFKLIEKKVFSLTPTSSCPDYMIGDAAYRSSAINEREAIIEVDFLGAYTRMFPQGRLSDSDLSACIDVYVKVKSQEIVTLDPLCAPIFSNYSHEQELSVTHRVVSSDMIGKNLGIRYENFFHDSGQLEIKATLENVDIGTTSEAFSIMTLSQDSSGFPVLPKTPPGKPRFLINIPPKKSAHIEFRYVTKIPQHMKMWLFFGRDTGQYYLYEISLGLHGSPGKWGMKGEASGELNRGVSGGFSGTGYAIKACGRRKPTANRKR